MNYTHYYLEVDEVGEPIGLSRVIEDERGIRGENYIDGRWVDAPQVVQLAMDPLWGERVPERDVPSLMDELRGK